MILIFMRIYRISRPSRILSGFMWRLKKTLQLVTVRWRGDLGRVEWGKEFDQSGIGGLIISETSPSHTKKGWCVFSLLHYMLKLHFLDGLFTKLMKYNRL